MPSSGLSWTNARPHTDSRPCPGFSVRPLSLDSRLPFSNTITQTPPSVRCPSAFVSTTRRQLLSRRHTSNRSLSGLFDGAHRLFLLCISTKSSHRIFASPPYLHTSLPMYPLPCLTPSTPSPFTSFLDHPHYSGLYHLLFSSCHSLPTLWWDIYHSCQTSFIIALP